MTDTPDPKRDLDAAEAALQVLDRLESADLSAESVDTALQLLADKRRRLLLEVVRTYDEELTLPDAAEEVARRETGRPVVDLPAEHVKRVYISLYHDHLPRLVDAGLLEYEQERDLVEPGYSR
ncbi:DUF7344 domain-containing protein [Natrialbaceae archaeon AArc-T1-2]|uniref:DUF7344 domain-containing protein n=1 Tax=Natrialbaceae archaeon AArc-T1-2 TaxID=3053904 RepID=UPI00255B1E14|nr:hypothetical protein [Natrialbaceae archaeon AArc-T1-2]WIV66030.1 hypothetical protein QQ977_10015 [Natrialbaceae archaeon AArc-T1-2]